MAVKREITAGRETVSGQVYEHGRPKGWVDSWRPQTKTRRLLAQADEILVRYAAQLPLTVRQVFYILVAQYGYEKTEKAAVALYEMLATARRARRIDWTAIRDDGVTTINPKKRFASEASFFDWLGRAWVDQFEIDPTIAQPAVEVWCEAAGMTKQLDTVCDPYGVAVYSPSGFDGLTTKIETVERIVDRNARARRGRRTVVLRIGDWDPSGRCAIDAFAADVYAFLEEYREPGDDMFGGISSAVDLSDLLTVEHIAVTEDQVDQHDLPTTPQKATDKRAGFMPRTVQAEALPPDVLAGIVRDEIEAHLDLEMLAWTRHRSGLEQARVIDRFYDQRSCDWWAESGFTASRETGEMTS
jgi:hypothetical protein